MGNIMPRVALHTLGCKVNQYETEKIAEDFRARGFEEAPFSGVADVYVINTCTVTNTADSKSRQAARAAARRNPGAAVVLTGCYADTSADQLSELDGITMVIGNSDKSRLAQIVIESLYPEMPGRSSVETHLPGRTRALLKVQDGCDQFCAYCAVPLARSVMSSRPMDEAISEAESLAKRGYKEIVLTGIRLGRYEPGLVELIGALAGISGIKRIRLSSIELTDVPDGLLELMADKPKICLHLHLPLQSGSDEVLARMNRPYTALEFEAFAAKARALMPKIGITTDIMVGFPGETEAQFEETCSLAQRVKFSRSHVFPFSVRPGTAAAEMKDDVSSSEKTRRKKRLTELTDASMREFAEGLVCTTANVLVEGKKVQPSLWSGLTDNYVRVTFEGQRGSVGEIVDIEIESAADGIAHGRQV